MDDRELIALFFERSERAVTELEKRYGASVKAIASNILKNSLDVEECVSDTYMEIWRTIPPKRPENLGAYVHTVARNTAMDRYDANTAMKRNSYYDTALDELEGVIASPDDIEAQYDARELSSYINSFLEKQPYSDRYIFVRRYWYADPVSEIAKNMKLSVNAVSLRILRLRKRLRKYLEEEGLL